MTASRFADLSLLGIDCRNFEVVRGAIHDDGSHGLIQTLLDHISMLASQSSSSFFVEGCMNSSNFLSSTGISGGDHGTKAIVAFFTLWETIIVSMESLLPPSE